MSGADNRWACFRNGNTAANSISAAQGKDQGRRSSFASNSCSHVLPRTPQCRQDTTQMAQLQPGWAAAARGWWSRLGLFYIMKNTVLKIIGNLRCVIRSSKVNPGLWERAACPAGAQHSSWCIMHFFSCIYYPKPILQILHFPEYFSQWTSRINMLACACTSTSTCTFRFLLCSYF